MKQERSHSIFFIDRATGLLQEEKIWGEPVLRFLYGNSFGKGINTMIAKIPFFSKAYGVWQRMPWTRKQIAPFIAAYGIDPSEFLEPVEHFRTFNDFFIRRLKPEARPITPGDENAVIPADGRYLFFQNHSKSKGILVKGQLFSLEDLLHDRTLAKQYAEGALVIARLCPTDYHRFHFPIDCVPEASQLINGPLYSVNPIAIRQNIHIFTENKRAITPLSTPFGEILFIEVGATCVGSIHQTYTPHLPYRKGEEKGYFSFGGSTLLLLFKPNSIRFDTDLIDASEKGLEIRCLLGQRMGVLSRIT